MLRRLRMVLYNTQTHNNLTAFLRGRTTMNKAISLFLLTVFSLTLISSVLTQTAFSQQPQLLDPLTIPKFVNQLDQSPTVYIPNNVTDNTGKIIRQEYTVKGSEFTQQIC